MAGRMNLSCLFGNNVWNNMKASEGQTITAYFIRIQISQINRIEIGGPVSKRIVNK